MLGRGGGQVVRVLVFYSKDSSSINQKNFYIQKHENNLNNKTDESNHPIISNGLKHLTMRKQERVYSAGKFKAYN